MRTATRLFAMIALLALLSPAVWAQVTLPHYDGFDYQPGSTLGGQGAWVNNNSGDSIQVVSGNLSYPGFPASTGNHVSFDGAGVDPTVEFTLTSAGTVYYSYLLKVTALGGLAGDGYCSGFYQSPTSTTSAALVWLRLDGGSNEMSTRFVVN